MPDPDSKVDLAIVAALAAGMGILVFGQLPPQNAQLVGTVMVGLLGALGRGGGRKAGP